MYVRSRARFFAHALFLALSICLSLYFLFVSLDYDLLKSGLVSDGLFVCVCVCDLARAFFGARAARACTQACARALSLFLFLSCSLLTMTRSSRAAF